MSCTAVTETVEVVVRKTMPTINVYSAKRHIKLTCNGLL